MSKEYDFPSRRELTQRAFSHLTQAENPAGRCKPDSKRIDRHRLRGSLERRRGRYQTAARGLDDVEHETDQTRAYRQWFDWNQHMVRAVSEQGETRYTSHDYAERFPLGDGIARTFDGTPFEPLDWDYLRG